MTDWLLALVPQYGLWLLLGTTFLSCLALPIPASVLMLTAGGFVAAGDLVLWQAFSAAALGGVLGDQTGYWAGRRLGATVMAARDPARDALLQRAQAMLDRGGFVAIFLTRWLFSPLGPWVNLLTGSARYRALPFALASVAGESVWAGLYIGAGYGFAGNLTAASDMLGSALGLIAAGTALILLGIWLRAALKSA